MNDVDISSVLQEIWERVQRNGGFQPDPTEEELAHKARLAWLVEADKIGVPARLAEASFSSDHRTQALILTQDYLPNLESGRALLMLGPTGVGKTYAAVAAMRACDRAARRGRAFFYFPALAGALLDRERSAKALEMAKKRDFVVFDDLGTEYFKEGGMLQAFVDEIFYEREGNALPTVITSNLTVEEFKTRMSDRIVDRLRGSWGRVVQVPGESMRRKG